MYAASVVVILCWRASREIQSFGMLFFCLFYCAIKGVVVRLTWQKPFAFMLFRKKSSSSGILVDSLAVWTCVDNLPAIAIESLFINFYLQYLFTKKSCNYIVYIFKGPHTVITATVWSQWSDFSLDSPILGKPHQSSAPNRGSSRPPQWYLPPNICLPEPSSIWAHS